MSKSQTNPNQTILLLSALLLVIGIGGAYLKAVPALKQARQDNAELTAHSEQLSNQINQLNAAKQQLTAAQAELEAQGVNMDIMRAHFPVTEDLPSLYVQLERKISEEGNNLVTPSYQVGEPVLDAATNEVKIPVTIAAIGKYDVLKKFIASLQDEIRPLSFTQVSYSESSTSSAVKPGDIQPGMFSLSATGFAVSSQLSAVYQSSQVAQ